MKKVKCALIGSGNISYVYLNTLKNGGFSIVEMVGCADIVPEKSKARAQLFGIRDMTVEEILNDPEIEIVLNTTNNAAHHEVSHKILQAGKHVYSEKAMDTNFPAAKELYDLAQAKGLRFAAAPDCYLGSAYQTARKLVDDGWIGEPLFANAFCYRGYKEHEREADYAGAGAAGTTITYDMSGYYYNVLISLLGPVQRVSGFARHVTRIHTNPRHENYKKPVQKQAGATLNLGALHFHNGCYASVFMTSEGVGPEIPRVEIFGTQGVLHLPDPNCFGGYGKDVYLTRIGSTEKIKMPMTHAFGDTDPTLPTLTGKYEACFNSHRGIAVVDMAWAIRRNRPHRSGAELALHAVEIAAAIDESEATNQTITLTTKPERPAPLTAGMFGISAESGIDT
ncbi:MAG: Gfo/Idh/MocA family oxidoreductase [Defluviitaleaceae bacterium]|nr:Gfo/Idh/MocA family oxidoreductase [Defluviitaleaceae bacterium]MCL2274881.1 Gfo/Idh/MocA family oxidoreductase [Defluviitaleaceae bacterium]